MVKRRKGSIRFSRGEACFVFWHAVCCLQAKVRKTICAAFLILLPKPLMIKMVKEVDIGWDVNRNGLLTSKNKWLSSA